MDVLELSIRADAESAEALAAALNEYAYGGAVIEQVVTPEQGETLDAARPFTVRAFLLNDETVAEKRRRGRWECYARWGSWKLERWRKTITRTRGKNFIRSCISDHAW